MKRISAYTALAVGTVLCINLAFASDIDTIKASLSTATTNLIQKYEDTISALQAENTSLKNENTRLRAGYTGAIANCTTSTVANTSTGKTTTTTTTATKTGAIVVVSTGSFATTNTTYIAIMQKIQANSGSIFTDNGLTGTLSIGLFEFIEPGVFFISIDDGNNSTGNTAFKYKMVFSYDSSLGMKKEGVFTYLPDVGKYLTTYGKNAYAKATRIKVKNPYYKGKLLEETTATTTSSSSTTTTTTTTTTATTEATLAQVKAAYDKNDIPTALSLSNSYIAKNPTNVEVLTIRYRGYFMIGKLTESLAEIAKIEVIQGSSFSSKVACDGKKIATSAKNTSLTTHYTGLCKK